MASIDKRVSGDRRPAFRPYVDERDGRIAVVTGIPVEECPACGEVWFAEEVVARLEMLLDMLDADVFAVRPFEAPATHAA
jgi:hypothetical protein